MSVHGVQYRFEGNVIRGLEHLPANIRSQQVPVVMMIPGLGTPMAGPHRMMYEMSQALEQKEIASVRFDFLGSGDSDGHFHDTSLTSQIRQTLYIFDALVNDERFDSTRISLVGFSMGALVAGIVAGIKTSLTKKLVLVSPSVNIRDIAMKYVGKLGPEVNEFDFYGNRASHKLISDILSTNIEHMCEPYDGSVLVLSGGRDRVVRLERQVEFIQTVYHGRATHLSIQEADHAFQHFKWKEYIIDTAIDFIA